MRHTRSTPSARGATKGADAFPSHTQKYLQNIYNQKMQTLVVWPHYQRSFEWCLIALFRELSQLVRPEMRMYFPNTPLKDFPARTCISPRKTLRIACVSPVSSELIHALREILSFSLRAKGSLACKVVNSDYFIWTALQDFQLCRYCRRFVINSLKHLLQSLLLLKLLFLIVPNVIYILRHQLRTKQNKRIPEKGREGPRKKGKAQDNEILSNFYCQLLPLNLLTGRYWQLFFHSHLIIHLLFKRRT